MFSRLFLGGIRQGIRNIKEMTILIKRTFCISEFIGSSFVRPWFLSRPKGSNDYSILGLLPEEDREGTKKKILRKGIKV